MSIDYVARRKVFRSLKRPRTRGISWESRSLFSVASITEIPGSQTAVLNRQCIIPVNPPPHFKAPCSTHNATHLIVRATVPIFRSSLTYRSSDEGDLWLPAEPICERNASHSIKQIFGSIWAIYLSIGKRFADDILRVQIALDSVTPVAVSIVARFWSIYKLIASYSYLTNFQWIPAQLRTFSTRERFFIHYFRAPGGPEGNRISFCLLLIRKSVLGCGETSSKSSATLVCPGYVRYCSFETITAGVKIGECQYRVLRAWSPRFRDPGYIP